MLTGMKTTAVPSSIHCDHLIEAFEGGDKDVARSNASEKEIYGFLEGCGDKFGIGFWKPGSGEQDALGGTTKHWNCGGKSADFGLRISLSRGCRLFQSSADDRFDLPTTSFLQP